MLKRQTAKGSDQVKVTFIIPHDPNQERVFVAGDFNDWNPSDLLLIKRSNNTRSASVTLAAGKRYAFRYCTEDGQWFNDDAADAYEPSEHGSENCIIIT
ncbi:MAG: isoamylase early set domain-containing protein [Chloroflexota bacterium]|jgi:1,4-alpha-glucan branching enzyme|nr:isoamylase early set domain-containing protein [Chloroflexota bacterium]